MLVGDLVAAQGAEQPDAAPVSGAGRGLPPVATPALTGLIASVAVVAALYYGQDLLVPIVLAALLAFVLAPAVFLLERLHLPRVLSVLLAVLLAFLAIFALGSVVAHEVSVLAAGMPAYEATVMQKWHALTSGDGLIARTIGSALPNGRSIGAPGSASSPISLALAGRLAQPLLGPLGTAGVVLVFTIFILLYNEDLRDRLVRLVGRQDLHRTIFAMNDAARRLSRYFLFQLMLNAAFGVLIAGVLTLIGLPGAILWGIVAGLMRFVPFIGVFISVSAPLALAIAVTPGWSTALAVLAIFLIGEAIMGQVVEPLLYGHSTGISPVAIIVATAFWALLWGPVGLLIATPLTVCLVVVGRHVEQLAFFDVLFGDTSPLSPAETFYQRALEGKARFVLTNARQRVKETSLSEYYDHVALDGLVLAQHDRAHDSLAFERLEAVHAQVETLLSGLRNADAAASRQEATVPPAAWRQDGAILCIPGRGQLDDLAAEMAVQVMGRAGFGARLTPNAALSATGETAPDFAGVKLCCLSVLEHGSSAAGIRYFVKRMQKLAPDAAIAVALWRASGDSPLLAALRSEGENEHLVLSIGELLAFARAISAQKETVDA